MTGDLECARCGESFGLRDDHTEIVRRDFRDEPHPSTIEYLCEDCWAAYLAFIEGG